MIFKSKTISDLYFIDEPTDADVVPGGTIQFNCKVKHENQFIDKNIKWYKDDEILMDTSSRIQMLTKGTLIITNAQSQDIGLYRCQVEVQVCFFGGFLIKIRLSFAEFPEPISDFKNS